MNKTLATARDTVAESAPKIVTITIPLDKVGEVIGPKGKVINTIQQETGAEIAVDDDGSVGIVTIGSPDNAKVEEAKARILAIVDPPTADLGGIYNGRVVSITKFGAFINILPGRDGLVHISKLGNGQRVNRVEDVLEVGDEMTVRVEDIDDRGKVSLMPVGADGKDLAVSSDEPRQERAPRQERGGGAPSAAVAVSFEDEFDAELRSEFGDLGPGGQAGGNEREGGGGGRRHR